MRVGNAAALHKQHDVFGEMVLALTPLFLDARFREQVTPPVLDLVTELARRAIAVAGTPDAGIWELPHRVAAADLQLAHVLGGRRSHDADRAGAHARCWCRSSPRRQARSARRS